MVSSRSSTIRLPSVAKFPLMRASWSNSALVLMEYGESKIDVYRGKDQNEETKGESETERQ